jgi:hypothetical protein
LTGLDLQFTAEEKNFFLGNGQNAKFWEDRWINGRFVRKFAPQLYACIPKRRRKIRTVAEGLDAHHWARDIHGTLGVHEVGQYIHLWQMIEHRQLSMEDDKLLWKWHATGKYTAKSAYLATFQGSTNCASWKLIWKSWAPNKVRFFHMDRCWTSERLARHGLQHHPR